MILCCSCSENKEQEKDMSFAVSPEIMICRVIDAIASNDQQAYCKYYPDSVSSYNQSFDDIYENYAMQCREFGVNYEITRSTDDFNIYIINDKRNTEGMVSFSVYLKDSNMIKFHIKTQYDMKKKGYCIEEIIPRNAGEATAQQSYIKENYSSIDIDNIEYK